MKHLQSVFIRRLAEALPAERYGRYQNRAGVYFRCIYCRGPMPSRQTRPREYCGRESCRLEYDKGRRAFRAYQEWLHQRRLAALELSELEYVQ